MNKCQKEAWTYTKWITAINTALYFGLVLFSLVSWVVTARREFPQEILSSVTVPYMSVMGFYFGKSLLENKWKSTTKSESEDGEA